MSIYSSDSKEHTPLLASPHGTYKVKYESQSDWDFHLDTTHRSIDLSLILPHYRSRNQPADNRLNLFVGNESGSVKIKVSRGLPHLNFNLEVQASTSDVTVWIPSDFRGRINYTGRATYSAGFVNHIMRNTRINNTSCHESFNEDNVLIVTLGHITFRMLDAHTGAPECLQKEALKRLFGCSRKVPETPIDWDFLIEDQ